MKMVVSKTQHNNIILLFLISAAKKDWLYSFIVVLNFPETDIDKEELYKMFKAYFYLSMEAVREAVKVIEEELILNYNEDATTPVSSAFVGLPGK